MQRRATSQRHHNNITIHNQQYTLHQQHCLLQRMDFAPYQDTAPETARTVSPPPPTSPRPRSPSPIRSSTDPFATPALPHPSYFGNDRSGPASSGNNPGNLEGGRLNINLFETSLPIRLDYEALLAYLLLPPAGGVLLLVLEHKSDYVRYARISYSLSDLQRDSEQRQRSGYNRDHKLMDKQISCLAIIYVVYCRFRGFHIMVERLQR